MQIIKLILILLVVIRDSSLYSPDSNDIESINHFLSLIENVFSVTQSLIILDDCAVSKDLKSRTNNFVSLAFSGRHISLSVMGP